MTLPLPLTNRYLRIGLIMAVLLFGIVLLLAPATGQKTSGSTYNRAPEGYLGWFGYMEAQGTPVQRWRGPLEDLPASNDTPQTLLRIYPGMVNPLQAWDREWLKEWLAAGNTLIALGVNTTITDAPFTTEQESPFGAVVVKTRRREDIPPTRDRHLLGDRFGAVVWQRPTDHPGQLVLVATPHLAANAYLDAPGNYSFLASLATQASGSIWVDEYLHGFKAADVIVGETVNSWGAYLAQTPLKIVALQIIIIVGLFLVAQNRRLGNLKAVKPPAIDNSRAYIDALAGVLHKAASTTFLVDMITKAERTTLQKALGFHAAEVEDSALQTAWTQQTGQSGQDLSPLLRSPQVPALSDDHSLKTWLQKLQHIRQTPIR